MKTVERPKDKSNVGVTMYLGHVVLIEDVPVV
jgi:hypothetical protein